MSISNYLEDKIQNMVLRNVSYTPPTTVYACLYTSDPTDADTGTEVSGNGYARQSITFGASSNGTCTNSNVVTFPVATGSWGTVTHLGIRDASSLGNLLYSGALGSSVAVAINNQLIFNIGQISITLD